MPFLRPSLTTLNNQALSDVITGGLPGVQGGLLPVAILRVMALVQAGLAWEQYGYLDWIAKQAVPYTATQEFLEAWAALKGILRKVATVATGTATITGNTINTAIPIGSSYTRSDGFVYETTTDVLTDSSGNATVVFASTLEGALGNADAGISLTLQSPIAGINPIATVATAIVGGADIETDASLRTRMLIEYAKPPNGGSANDYVIWALEVPGVTRAWAVPSGQGIGTVSVYFMMDSSEIAHSGFPQGTNGADPREARLTTAAGDQLLVAQHIYPLRPVTAAVWCAAPVASPINIVISDLSPLTSPVQVAVTKAITDAFVRLADANGVVIYQSDITQAIESVVGVLRYTLTTPAVPVTIAVGSIPTLGTITFS